MWMIGKKNMRFDTSENWIRDYGVRIQIALWLRKAKKQKTYPKKGIELISFFISLKLKNPEI